jgi:hypothetical protein
VQLSNLFYYLHAMPARDIRNPGGLAHLPLRVDGKIIGSRPVFLRAGRHGVSSAASWVKINLLDLQPVTLPTTRDLHLQWRQLSPTGINVTVPGNRKPFLLVFGSGFHPEWQAKVDGNVLDHVIVNGVSNGWIVPNLPQGGTIALRFTAQRWYVLSALVSLLSLIALIVLAMRPELWPRWSARR